MLWGYSASDVIGKDVKILFSDAIIASNDFVNSIVNTYSEKIVGVRQEILISDINKNEKSVLILLSEASYGDDQTFTAFVQNIEVELF
ncbi:MAG: hypothetical protein IPO21_04540 [Bacteroidales bacterium]|nr:hypothetical protein [Bacteroidales bacterium]